MTDHPILFSAPMVRALIEGHKTQTRRVLKLPTKTPSGGPIYERTDMGGWEATTVGGGSSFTLGKQGERVPMPERAALWHRTTGVCMSTGFNKGDRLWVRETWQTGMGSDGPQITFKATPDYFPIDAWDGPDEGAGPSFNYERCPGATWHTNLSDLLSGAEGSWRPPIHMPRWASRLTLTVTGVRVQRLQEITPEDAEDEGIQICGPDVAVYRDNAQTHPEARRRFDAYRLRQFSDFWKQINGPDSWAANPWVVALTFTVEKRNIDA